jgi:hypothetical protein
VAVDVAAPAAVALLAAAVALLAVAVPAAGALPAVVVPADRVAVVRVVRAAEALPLALRHGPANRTPAPLATIGAIPAICIC